MEYMKDLENLCDSLSEQLSDMSRKAKNGMSSGDLDTIEKLTHSLASVKKIMKIMKEDDGEYSGWYPMGGAYADGRDGSYNRGSYARGRGQRRDGMGRYSGEYGYSRNDLADKMRELMRDAPDDRTRQEIQRMVEKLEG